MEDVAVSEDVAASTDTTDDSGKDTGIDVDVVIPEVANLLIEDQSLEDPFTTLSIRVALLPADATADGKLRIRFSGGANDGLKRVLWRSFSMLQKLHSNSY